MSEKQPEVAQKKPKLLEPTMQFATRYLKIGEDDSTEKIPVTELVHEGHLLLSFPNIQRFLLEGYEKAIIELGENVDFTEDGESVIASTIGYPKVKKIRKPDVPGVITVISLEPLFIYSEDKMRVTLAIHPPLDDAHSLQKEDINKLITDQSIFYGIQEHTLESALQFINSGAKEFKKFIIAKGKQVGSSRDAYVRFDIEIGPIAGTILENGNIDFRDRRIMVGVEKGQQIATKVLAVQGSPGINIFGEETEAKEGKDVKVEVLNDAVFSSETLQVTAKKDGVLSVVNNNMIKVCSHQIITSDIDYQIGNVQSKNSVTIQGSVQPGFKIDVAGDLKIIGGIMSAQVVCNANMVINGGVTGKNSTIVTSGDIDLNFIEQGIIEVGGIAVIRRQAYYTKILAGSDIRCHQQSTIMGGQLVAEGDITLGDVGAENSTPSIIAAGVVPKRLQNLFELKQSIIDQQDAIIQWLQRYRGSIKSKKIKKMEKELAETKLQLLRLNLIPGSGLYSKAAGPEDALPDSEEYSTKDAIEIDNIHINIHGTVYKGTEIRIGNQTMKLEKTVSTRQFKLHPTGKRIIAGRIKNS